MQYTFGKNSSEWKKESRDHLDSLLKHPITEVSHRVCVRRVENPGPGTWEVKHPVLAPCQRDVIRTSDVTI